MVNSIGNKKDWSYTRYLCPSKRKNTTTCTRKSVLTHDWVEISDGTNKKECISYSFLFAMIFLIFRYLCYN